MMAECTEKSLKELADELLNLTPESLAIRVINDSDVEWCLSELSDILAADVAPVKKVVCELYHDNFQNFNDIP